MHHCIFSRIRKFCLKHFLLLPCTLPAAIFLFVCSFQQSFVVYLIHFFSSSYIFFFVIIRLSNINSIQYFLSSNLRVYSTYINSRRNGFLVDDWNECQKCTNAHKQSIRYRQLCIVCCTIKMKSIVESQINVQQYTLNRNRNMKSGTYLKIVFD